MQRTHEETPQPLLLNIDQACKVLCLGKTKIYELIADKDLPLPVLYIGRAPRFPYRALQQWIEERLRLDAA